MSAPSESTGSSRRPRILVTVADASVHDDRATAIRKNELYVESVLRHGGEAIVLDARSDDATRGTAFAAMDGLLLTGGADIDPARYGQPMAGSLAIEPERDALEAAAWEAATARRLPVLGICRGLQAINVFSGGSLIQHVEGHSGPSWTEGAALTHPLRVGAGTKLAGIIEPGSDRPRDLDVNSYHHQAIGPGDLAPGLQPNAWAASPLGELVEGFESADSRFVVGIQCHPERTESTPEPFERLFAAFVDACRGA